MENCDYNCVQALARKQASLWRIPTYIADAEKCGHPWCADLWKKIQAHEAEHAEWLRQAIDGLCKEGKFK